MSSEIKVTNIKHSSSGSNNLVLASDGSATIGQISSSSVFPAGHVIQFFSDTYGPTSAIDVTTTSDDYLGSNLQVTITPKATGNKLLITAFIPGIFSVVATRSLNAGFAYDTDFASSNGTTIGPKAAIAHQVSYASDTAETMEALQYSIVVSVGTNAPSAGSTQIIRPIFQSNVNTTKIAYNASSTAAVMTLTVMEIQA